MPSNISQYTPILDSLKIGQAVEISEQGEGGRFLSPTDIRTITSLVSRRNLTASLSKNRLCVRSNKEAGAIMVYLLPKFTADYVAEMRAIRTQASEEA